MVMNPPKCTEYDYIHFLIATPSTYSCTEAAHVHPPEANPPVHDSLNRLLHRLPADSEGLWTEATSYVKKDQGILVIDNSTLDKPYAEKIEIVIPMNWDKHKKVKKMVSL